MADMNAKHLMCRGKAKFGWVEGYFLPYYPEMRGEGPVIISYGFDGCVKIMVDAETVTACSGLTSATGKLIYDQDIVINKSKSVAGIVEFSAEDGTFAVINKEGEVFSFGDIESEDFYIVGNSIDNQDYLEFV
ncbi:MAG: hypothetical protein IKM48_03315 [Clostridia bacterium]|nr:hypothetical protein [Clostridia bacterium]